MASLEDELSQSEGQYYDEVEGLYLDGVAKKLRNTEEGKRIAIQEAIAELHEELDPFLPAILKCLSILHVRRGQLVTSDPYGNPVTKGWHDEIDYFIRRNLLKDDSRRLEAMKASDEGSYVGAPYVRLKETIDLVAQYAYHLIPKTSDELTEGKALVWADLEPLEFERRCCESLIAIGWQARITAGSGDQGIDVIATYGNQKLVVQCKRYNGSVGNGAVQEIIAGRSFEKADLATVVSTGSFTRSARELAAAAGVTLIHPSQIAETYGRSPMNPAAGVGSIEPNRFIDYILTEIHLAETRALETAYANYNASDLDSYDDLETHYQQALDILRSTKCASTSMLQRRLRIGYNRAAHVMDIMEEEGIVGPQNGSSPRDILVDLETL